MPPYLVIFRGKEEEIFRLIKLKKLLLLLSLLLAANAWASIPDEVHEKCKDVKDYVGYIQIFTNKVFNTNSYEFKLKEALRLLPGRIDWSNNEQKSVS